MIEDVHRVRLLEPWLEVEGAAISERPDDVDLAMLVSRVEVLDGAQLAGPSIAQQRADARGLAERVVEVGEADRQQLGRVRAIERERRPRRVIEIHVVR